MFNQKSIQFCNQLKITLPIIQAPMAGAIVPPSLVKEVSQYGGLGSLALGYLSLKEAKALIQETKILCSKPFAVNIFISREQKAPHTKQIKMMLNFINKERVFLNLTPLDSLPFFTEPSVDALIDLIIDEKVSVLSFTFGLLSKANLEKLRLNNIYTLGTATTVAEAKALQELGCQAVIAQSYEAGGHRGGGYLQNQAEGLVGGLALIPSLVDALHIPVIAAGGIMDGRGVAASLCLGASAVQMGTAFLTCEESNASVLHKRAILESRDDKTCLTYAFTGKIVRAFANEFIKKSEEKFKSNQFLPYPIQHQLTKELRQCAHRQELFDYAGLWSGQGANLSRSMRVSDLLRALEKETFLALSQFK